MEKIIDFEDVKRFRSARVSTFLNLIFYGSLGLSVFNFVFRHADALTGTYYGYDGRAFMIFICLFAIIPLFFVYAYWDFRAVRVNIMLLQTAFLILSIVLIVRYFELRGVSDEPEFIFTSLFLTQNLLIIGLFTCVSVSLFIIDALLLTYPFKIEDIFTPGAYWDGKMTGKAVVCFGFMILFFAISILLYFGSSYGLILNLVLAIVYGIIGLIHTIVIFIKDMLSSLDYYKSHHSPKYVLIYFVFALVVGLVIVFTFLNLTQLSLNMLFIIFGLILILSFTFRFIVDGASKPKQKSDRINRRLYEEKQKANGKVVFQTIYFTLIVFGAAYLFAINSDVFSEFRNYALLFLIIACAIPVSYSLSNWVSYNTQILFGLLLEGLAALFLYYFAIEYRINILAGNSELPIYGNLFLQSLIPSLLLGIPVGICISGFGCIFSEYHNEIKESGYLFEFGMILLFAAFFSGLSLSRIYRVDGLTQGEVLRALEVIQNYSYNVFLAISGLILINLLVILSYALLIRQQNRKEETRK